jgi:pimeloyl-ACP methyl ester carboxylesterase
MNKIEINEQSLEQIGFVFIHGAGLESRIWGRVVEGLKNPFLLVDFPQREGEKAWRQKLSLQDYVTHIERQIQAWEVHKFIIVAHSIGGVLALKIADIMADRLVGFIAVGATIPKKGGSFLSIFPFAKRSLMRVLLHVFGTQPPESAIRKVLCSDLSTEQATEIVRSFVSESMHIYTDRIEAQAPNVSKLYLKLTEDQELSLSQQDEMVANFNPQHIELLESGHLPMLSKPDELRLALHAFLSHLE